MTHIKRIFIVGHTGAQKSKLGEALAEKLDWQYVDANPGLERYIGRQLSDILGPQGEQAFHECEADIIVHYASKEHVVVVLEEVVIATEKNRQLLSSEYVVYSKVSTAIQMERWSSGRSPVLPIADQKAFLDQQHNERDSLFEEVASLTLESGTIEDNVNTIIKSLQA